MSEKFEGTKEITERKNKILKAMTNFEIHPTIIEEEVSLEKYTKVPISQFINLGTGFEPLAAAFQKVVKDNGTTSGLYNVTIPKGAHLAKFKNGSGFLGSVLKGNGAVGGGQAILNPLVFNPTMLFTAAALASMDKKLDNIQQMQRDFLEILRKKDESSLKGNLKFLTGVLRDYKYNWNNATYVNSQLTIVMQIKKEAFQQIDYYRDLITIEINKKSFFNKDKWLNKQLEEIQYWFKYYQLALYLYSFSSYLGVILLKNFDQGYLDSISDEIKDYSLMYNKLSEVSYKQVDEYIKSSLQSKVRWGLTSTSRIIENSLGTDQSFKKFAIKNFTLFNEIQEKKYLERREQNMKELKVFLDKQDDYIRPFLENIDTVNKLYNQSIDLVFNEENVYIGTIEN